MLFLFKGVRLLIALPAVLNFRRKPEIKLRLRFETTLNKLEALTIHGVHATVAPDGSVRLEGFTGAGFQHLTGLRRLRELTLYDTRVANDDLEPLRVLSQLKKLSVWPATDTGLQHIRGLNQLEELTLYDTAITDDGLEYLKEMKQLRMLDLTGTHVKGVGLDHLKGLDPKQANSDVWFPG